MIAGVREKDLVNVVEREDVVCKGVEEERKMDRANIL